MLLARGAVHTLLIDDRSLREYSPPAHALMRGGVLQLSRWGLLDAIAAAGTPAVKRTTLRYDGARTVITVKPSHGVDALYVPHPDVLDPLLLRAATDAGVEVRDDVSVADLLTDDGRVVGVQATASGGSRVDLTARLVLGADGVRSTVARTRGGYVLPHGLTRCRDDVRVLVGSAHRRLRVDVPTECLLGFHPDQPRRGVCVRQCDTGTHR